MGDEETPGEKLKKSVVSNIRAVLTSKAKVGVPLHYLPNEYEELCFEKLDLKCRELGYGSLEQFLRDIPDVCWLSRAPEGYIVVKGIASREDEHIYKFVAGQKKSKKKKTTLSRSFNMNQVIRRGASQFSSGKKPNFKKHNTYHQANTYMTARLFAPKPGVPISFSQTTAVFMNNQQFSKRSQSYKRTTLPNRYIPKETLAPRFRALQNLNNGRKNNTQVFFAPTAISKGNNEKIIMSSPTTSTPNSYLSQQEIINLERNLRSLLSDRPNGIWVTRIRPDYKRKFGEDLPADIRQVIVKNFLNFVKIESPVPDHEILYLIKENKQYVPKLEITMTPVNGNVHRTSNLSSLATDTCVTPKYHKEGVRPPQKDIKIESITLPNTGENVAVFICYVETLNRFFVQYADSIIDELVDQMQEFYDVSDSNYLMAKPHIGEYCCARYSTDRLWFRAKVLSVKEQKNVINESFRCRVMYVDYGNNETVVSNELKFLTEEFCQLPMQAIQCSLYDVYPTGEEKQWPDSTIQCFKEITEDKKLTLAIQEKNGNVLTVDLLDEDGQSICNHLAEIGKVKRSVSHSRSSSSLSESESKASSLWRSLSLESNEPAAHWIEFPDDGAYFDVMVSNIISTRDVCIIIIGTDYHERLEKLQSHMNKHYDNESVANTQQLEIGKFYAAFFDDSWCRVELLSMDGNDCNVFLVDHGNKTIVSQDDLKELLPKYFIIPFQSISCFLNDVSECFDPEILQYFSASVLGKNSIAYLIDRPTEKNGKYCIELYDTSSPENDVNINDELKIRIEAEKFLRPILPEPNTEHCQAIITHILPSGEFFIQILGPGFEKLQTLMKDMTSHFSQQTRAKEIVSNPEVGAICCAKFNHDGGWYRAVVKEVRQQQRQVKVEFIDYGNEATIPMLLIRKPTAVSEKVQTLPFQAVKCKLDQLSQMDYSEEECEKMKEFVNNYIDLVLVEVLRREGELPVIKISIPSETEEGDPVDFLQKYLEINEVEHRKMLDAYTELHKEDIDIARSSVCEESLYNNTAVNNTTFENISLLTPQNTARTNSHNTTLSEWDVIHSDSSPEKSLSSSEDIEVKNIIPCSNLFNIQEEKTSMNSEGGRTTANLPINSSVRSDSPATTYCALWGIPDMVISERVIEAIVQDTADPSRFSVIPTCHWSQLEDMHTEMLKFYNNYQPSNDVKPVVGDVCAVYHSDHEIWYRAVIHAQVEEQMVVKFPDFSSSLELVDMNAICPLQACFKVLPFLAIRCSLADIESQDGGTNWTNEAAVAFCELVMNETFQVEICSSIDRIEKSKPLCVRLHGASTKGERFVVNEQLVSLGLARPKGKAV